ncbi:MULTISPECIES: CHC2 zinc finger domain-containing protein [unclassified Thiomonas]|jgi:hypothetical protein|uniref:CHC2 zinc finger domain-containing protein n=1 Tax=unclassified Thiomonas TaxID=2625466 RepID=UPI0004DBCAC8|nr:MULTISPECIES: CHC2 zinc finger domain-containing protein [unclassified Thiomonas]CDW95179.1 conserved hypothetical protein [Thiomonas sp. CB2]VDY03779.1 conserved protein of unknown function [Thiomonas sp. Bio17B3]VDY09043.1 conserved protein of unknown function [Thiomonas sp. Sup16B3]VDY12029.1 conserved protein of unknown function [Thiomonas sp. OC7]VDY18754.1 conserved protein of unknown function [Thiomonas sp. CB2]
MRPRAVLHRSATPLARERLPDAQDYFNRELDTLHGRGPWRSALCPFHTERTPSLRVHVETGAFRCMACGAHGGDLIAFHMQRRNVDFKTACIALGCWTGGRRHA